MRVGPLKLKAQIYCGDELAMGPGKADLLAAIDREGSISAAGRALGMSYRRAWLLVATMNRCWREPLVEAHSGGGANRGAVVTESGREVLQSYRALERELEVCANGNVASALRLTLLIEPRPADE